MEWATLPLKKYAQFSGRSRRKEYWSFFLLMLAAYVVAGMVDGIVGMGGLIGGVYGPLTLLTALFFIIPSFSVGIRRLHDTERSGWWLLLGLIPLIGGLVLIYFFILEGTRGPNQYGADPKEGEVAAPRTV
jgi:uncharacterized membrane protein YhaH (DUF805 family)